jgi:hypothetical protein
MQGRANVLSTAAALILAFAGGASAAPVCSRQCNGNSALGISSAEAGYELAPTYLVRSEPRPYGQAEWAQIQGIRAIERMP